MVFSHLKIWWVSKKNSSALSCKEPVAAPSFKKKKTGDFLTQKNSCPLSFKKILWLSHSEKIWCSLI